MRYQDVPTGNSRGNRKLETGYFSSRFDLELFVLRAYCSPDFFSSGYIAQRAGCSESLVNLIINNAGRYIRLKEKI